MVIHDQEHFVFAWTSGFPDPADVHHVLAVHPKETGIAQLAFELVEDRRGGSQPPLNSGQAPAGTAVVRHETPFPVQVLFMRCGFRNSRLHRNDTWPGAYRIEVRL